MGTLQYTAPEVLWNEPREYTTVDVYALSVVSWEVLSVKAPFGGVAEPAVREKVKKGERPPIPSEWPKKAQEAIRRGWDGCPAKRGTAGDFLATMSEAEGALAAKTKGR